MPGDKESSLRPFSKLNKTFARRVGKSLATSKKQIIANQLPQRSFNAEIHNKMFAHQEVVLEIGFGMGEHLFTQIVKHPQQIFIGAEVYINGVAKLLEQVSEYEAQENINLNNLLIWAEDVDKLLEQIPDKSLSKIYVLFPDPWPKRKHHKKRLLGEARLPIIKSKLKAGGIMVFASDIDSYFDSVISLVENDKDLDFVSKDFTNPHDSYIITKYHKKALREGRISRFMQIYFK
jgi:release factor glutamine methyltransferase